MTATVSRPARAWAVSHRLLLTVVAFVIALAAAATIALTMLSSSGASEVSPAVPAPAEEQTYTERACQLARVPECS